MKRLGTKGDQSKCGLRVIGLSPKTYHFKQDRLNRPFPSSLVPLFQNESKGPVALGRISVCFAKKVSTSAVDKCDRRVSP